MDIVQKAKEYCLDVVSSHEDIFDLKSHIPEAEKWAKLILADHPKANEEVVLLSVWLHDVSHYVGDRDSDHAVRSEKMAREFLAKEGYFADKIEKVASCVRSHRCRDIQPETVEGKIMACADSASHMTDHCYIDVMHRGRFDYASGKIERDYRDVGLFPEVQAKLTPLYNCWKKLLEEYQKLGIANEKVVPYDC